MNYAYPDDTAALEQLWERVFGYPPLDLTEERLSKDAEAQFHCYASLCPDITVRAPVPTLIALQDLFGFTAAVENDPRDSRDYVCILMNYNAAKTGWNPPDGNPYCSLEQIEGVLRYLMEK